MMTRYLTTDRIAIPPPSPAAPDARPGMDQPATRDSSNHIITTDHASSLMSHLI